MTRDEAWELLNEFTKKEALIKHALAVEAIMRAYACKFGEDEEAWGVVGLLHDFDYEMYPSMEDHPFKGSEILKERGFPENLRSAIMAHAPHTGVPRDNKLKQTLFAIDELAGFITAVALVRPSKKVADVKVKSVRKKFNDKAFAAAVNRDDIRLGIEELGVDEAEHLQLCIDAMAGIADKLGL
ncbi:HDIG domain-containing metalloprotein [candidate division KSB1 bacterium]